MKECGFVAASELAVGDEIMNSSGGTFAVKKIEFEEKHETVYNFHVEDYHTYYVGENSVLVHNKCGDATNPLSEMSDDELGELGYKRHSDGSIRDSKGHFAGNSGTVPGTPGVDAAEKYLCDSNYTVKGREISVRGSDGTLRRYDIVAEAPDGTTIGIEVKSGSATRTEQQIRLDDELTRSGGLDTVGQKAANLNIDKISSVKVVHVDEAGNIIFE